MTKTADSAATILVVDDEESLTDMVASALRFAGYTVTTEDNGCDALRSVKNLVPDLVVLDVNMPEIDGFEVCRRMRRDGIDIPVMLLTPAGRQLATRAVQICRQLELAERELGEEMTNLNCQPSSLRCSQRWPSISFPRRSIVLVLMRDSWSR